MRWTQAKTARQVTGQSVVDGAGVRINRIIGSGRLNHIDPFVLLDEIKSAHPADYEAGFPTHPHRGIETITYMLRGTFRHRDSRGGGGLLTEGTVQWMTAGKGILHSEMPEPTDGLFWGFQLWLSLPAASKMVPPRYQHLSAETIPVVQRAGRRVKVISGTYDGTEGPAGNLVKTTYLDVRLEGAEPFDFGLAPEERGFCYVHTGRAVVNGLPAGERELVELASGGGVEVRREGEPAGFLLLAARPNNEPIARGGPFVMNTEEEMRQAYIDYENGTLF